MPGLPSVLPTGALARLEDAARSIVQREMRTLKVKEGARLFAAGDSASNYLMVKEGSIRVYVTTEAGREIVLYRVEPGHSCVLTAACLLSGSEYDAEAIAETETEAVILPKAAFDELMATSALFRQFVFSSYGERLHTLIGLVQEIAVRHLDRKLARFLVQNARAGVIAMTHQAIANELNSAREVISRLLNDFAEKGWLTLSRGQVRIVDEDSLSKFAGSV